MKAELDAIVNGICILLRSVGLTASNIFLKIIGSEAIRDIWK